jgi:hypothetical protein
LAKNKDAAFYIDSLGNISEEELQIHKNRKGILCRKKKEYQFSVLQIWSSSINRDSQKIETEYDWMKIAVTFYENGNKKTDFEL